MEGLNADVFYVRIDSYKALNIKCWGARIPFGRVYSELVELLRVILRPAQYETSHPRSNLFRQGTVHKLSVANRTSTCKNGIK